MDLELTTIARALETGGIYGLAGVMVAAVMRLYRDLKSVNEQVVRLTEQQTAVMVRVEGALLALRDAILCMSGQPARAATRMVDRGDSADVT